MPSRRRSTMGGVGMNHLGSVSENPEDDMNNGSDDDTLSTLPKVIHTC